MLSNTKFVSSNISRFITGISSHLQGWLGWTVLLVFLNLTPALTVLGVERFPPPDFEAGYQMPPTTTPSPRQAWMAYVDVTVLLIALSLATWFVHKKRSRKHIFGLTVFSLLYFGFYRKGCVCAIGSIQDVTLAAFNGGYHVPWTVLAFFLLPLLFTLAFGRVFCAAVCPLGAMQDVVVVRPVKVPPWLNSILEMVPFFYLGLAILFAATGSAFIICEYDPFIAFFRLNGPLTMFALGIVFLAIGMFVGRPYCRFLCPYGAILNLFSRIAKRNVSLSPLDCIHCQLCDVACPFDAIAEPFKTPPPPKPASPIASLGLTIFACLLLLIVGGWLGKSLAPRLARMHPTVSLAEQIANEDLGKIKEPTDASKAFRQSGKVPAELYQEAMVIRGRFALGSAVMGGWIGLVLAIQWLSLGRLGPWNRPAQDATPVRLPYETDPGRCVACGRCYTHCPKEIVRVKRFAGKKTIPLTSA
jgi:ferredoxin